MTNLLITVVLFPPIAWLVALFVSALNCTIDWLDHRDEVKAQRKEYDEQIKLYIAVLERETNDFEKGYWLARIWNLQEERRCLK